MIKEHERFQIGQKAVLIRDGKCLIAEIAKRPGMWELPGGRLEAGELREPAFRREIKEELGIDEFEILGLVDYEIWYHNDGTPFCAIVNLIKNDFVEIKISSEHLKFAWITKKQIKNYKYFWPASPRFIEKGFALLNLLNKK